MARVALSILLAGVLAVVLRCLVAERGASALPAPPVARASAAPEPAAPTPTPEPTPAPADRAALAAGAPPPAVERVAVRVVTVSGPLGGTERAGEIAFEILAHRPGPRPDPGAAEPGFPARSGRTARDAPLYAGRTDARGEASLELARAGLFAAGERLLAGRVVEPGYQQRVLLAKVTEDAAGASCELRLAACRGGTARGRVVDARGAGVPASVRLHRWIAPRGERKLDGGLAATVLADGTFELHLAAPVAEGILLADAGEAGTAGLAGLALAPEAAPQDLELVARGEGALRGRVTDDAGRPAAGLDLAVVLAELDEPSGSSTPPEPLHALRRIEGLGRTRVQLRTDAEGAFAVRGLRPEAYVVRARTSGHAWSGYTERLTPPVLARDAVLELRLARPHLSIELRDAEGAPWTGAALAVRGPATPLGGRPQAWPAAPTVMAFACSASGEPLALGEPLPGKATAPALAVFEVADGARYLVGAMGAGFDGALQVVEVPAGAGRVPVELRARPGELGTLVVRVVSAGRELGQEDEFELCLESTLGSAPLLARSPYAKGGPWVVSAAPGAYRVVAQGRPHLDSFHGTLLSPRTLGRSAAEVVLDPGTTRELTLALDAGARLEVRLSGEPSASDREATLAQHDWLADPSRAAQLASWSAGARLELVRAGDRPEPVLFRAEAYAGTSSQGTHLIERWPLGETHLSEALPAGPWTLLARLPGGREARAAVELLPGATTRVELGF